MGASAGGFEKDIKFEALDAQTQLSYKLFEREAAREEKGVVAPRFVFPLVLDACHKVIQGKPFDSGPNDSPLLEDFTKKVTALSKADGHTRERLVADATKALNESVKPAYEKLIAFLEEQAKRATEDDGVWKFRDGADFCESALHRTTTTNMSAKEIHETGLKEMARIQDEMNKIREKVGFKRRSPGLLQVHARGSAVSPPE